jgi:hypothetical protein
MMINELERVALTVDVPNYHLRTGDMGTVVDVTPNQLQYTVEFFTLDGETFAVVPLTPSEIRRVGSQEIANARTLG